MAIYGSYSEIYDMQTKDGNISALKFHTPQDGAPVEHLGGLFAQFRKYKYLGVEAALVPAQQLPLDPLQVSSVDGDGLVDPRDVLNPILHKHWNGERTLLDNYIDSYYTEKLKGTGGIGGTTGIKNNTLGQSIDEVSIPAGDSAAADTASTFYAMQLMDNSFKVSHVQDTLRIRMRPKVWDVNAQRPITSYADLGSYWNKPNFGEFQRFAVPEMTPNQNADIIPQKEIFHGRVPGYNGTGQQTQYYTEQEFMTAGMKPMGWMPTNNTFSSVGMVDGTDNRNKSISELSRVRLPKIYMHLMILPPAYKQNFYYRLVMKHKFLFKSMTSLKAIDSIDASAGWTNSTTGYENTRERATPKARLETLADASTYLNGSESSLETFNLELESMGGRFEFEEGVSDEYDDGSDAKEMRSLEEQINDILDGRQKEKTEE